jgi:hypothetical protein
VSALASSLATGFVIGSVGSVVTGLFVAIAIMAGGVAVVARRAVRSVKGPMGELAAARARSLGLSFAGSPQVRGPGRLSLTKEHLVFTLAFPHRTLAISRRDITEARPAIVRRRLVPGAPGSPVAVLDVQFVTEGIAGRVGIQVDDPQKWAALVR